MFVLSVWHPQALAVHLFRSAVNQRRDLGVIWVIPGALVTVSWSLAIPFHLSAVTGVSQTTIRRD